MADENQELRFDRLVCVSLAELVDTSGLTTVQVTELVELGALQPEGTEPEWRFPARAIELARTARWLIADFELTLPGAALALAYLERIRELESRLRELECQLPR